MAAEAPNIASLSKALRTIVDLAFHYHNVPKKELHADLLMYGFLSAQFPNVSRQHHVRMYGSTHPHRIDFRIGGTHPVVAEFVLRPPSGGSQLYGASNQSEVRKLCRVYATQAKLRALLLLDLHSEPLKKETLRESYAKVSSGPGKFERHPVRVLYASREVEFNFVWKP